MGERPASRRLLAPSPRAHRACAVGEGPPAPGVAGPMARQGRALLGLVSGSWGRGRVGGAAGRGGARTIMRSLLLHKQPVGGDLSV